MTGEIVFFAVVALAGCRVASGPCIPRPVRLAIAVLAGLAVFCIVTVLFVVIGLPTSLSLVSLAIVAVAIASMSARTVGTRDLVRIAGDTGLLTACCALAVVVTRMVEPGRSTRDSYDYTQIAGLLANGSGRLVDFDLLRTRLLGYPALNLAAFFDGRVHPTAVSVVVGCALLVILAFVVAAVLNVELDPRHGWALALLSLGALLTSYHFVFELFYVNSHLAVGAFVLVAMAPAVLAASMPAVAGPMALPPALCAAAIPLLRPEGGLLAMLIVIAAWRSQVEVLRVRVRVRVVAVAVAGTTIAWNLHLLRVARASEATTVQMVQPAATVALAVLLVIAAEWTLRRPAKVLLMQRVVELGLWVVLGLLAIADTATVAESLKAFYRNVFRGAGTWGPLMPLLLIAFVAVQLLLRYEVLRAPAYVIRTFFPLMFALAPIRDAAYRVGTGDSLNRSLTHVLPITVLVVLGGAVLGERRTRRTADLPEDVEVG